jgi:hypothetical protein
MRQRMLLRLGLFAVLLAQALGAANGVNSQGMVPATALLTVAEAQAAQKR